jgi:hypothetical protein
VIGLDARAQYTEADRAEEFKAAMRVYDLLGDMSFDVDSINVLHAALVERAAAAGKDPVLAKHLTELAGNLEEMRKKIVATTEGGAITGEERIREKTAALYGELLGYEGRPADYQLARIDSLTHELKDVSDSFNAFVAKDLPGINKSLTQKKLEPIHPVARSAWDAANSESGVPGGAGSHIFWERD